MTAPHATARHLRYRNTRRRPRLRLALLCGLIAALGWTAWVEGQIRSYSTRDEARPADAIAVFGAAEYDGRPSPVLRARLDQALALYSRGLAPLIITLGGSQPTDLHSEGGVGKDYLLAHDVPEADIIAETQSDDTEQSAHRLAAIARENQLHRIDVVSDGTHLFRIHAICESLGLEVYTSPRPADRTTLSFWDELMRSGHEIASYTAWRLHLH
jgi:uncharacterized SAM-binding protein YcdF (DUF218 family)